MYAWQATVQDESGRAIPFPVVYVYESQAGELADIFTSDGGPLSNPLTGDINGFVQFRAYPGDYLVEGRNGGSQTKTWVVTLGDRASPVSPRDFGRMGTGDDTEVVRKCLQYASENGRSVSFEGIESFSIQADAKIELNCDVDFCGADISLIGGMVENPSYSIPRFVAFLVSDPETPKVSSVESVNGANFAIGSSNAATGLMPSAGWLRTDLNDGASLPRISDRLATGSLTWRCVHKVDSDIKTQFKMPVDGSGVTTVFKSYRLMPSKRLFIKNISVDTSKFNNQTLFKVSRNAVTVDGAYLYESSSAPLSSVNNLFHPEECCDFTIKNVSGPSAQSQESVGSYILGAFWVSNLIVENCTFDGNSGVNFNWAGFATSNCNGIFVRGSDLNRIDIHAYGMNLFVDNCRISSRGIAIGQGGGDLVVTNTIYNQVRTGEFLLTNRTDYGGGWDGDISVSDCTINGANVENAIVSWTNVGNTVLQQSLPRSIKVSNIHFNLRAPNPGTGTGIKLNAIVLSVKDGSLSVVSPASISASGITCGSRWRVGMSLDLNSCVAPVSGGPEGCYVLLSDAVSTSVNSTSPTVNIPARKSVGSASIFRIDITLRNTGLTWVSLSSADPIYLGCSLRMIGGTLVRADIPNAYIVSYSGVNFTSALVLSGETHAPIGAVRFASREVSVVGGRLSGAYDFRNAVAVSGVVTTASGIGSALLPAGATRQSIFTGYTIESY